MPGRIPLFQSSEFWWISASVWRKTLLTLGFVNLKRNDENLSSLWSQTPNVGFLSQWKERLWFPNHPKKHLRSKQDPSVAHNLWVDCFWPQEIWTHAHAHTHTYTGIHYTTSHQIKWHHITIHHHTYIHACIDFSSMGLTLRSTSSFFLLISAPQGRPVHVGNPRSGNGAWPCFIACRRPAMLVSMRLGDTVTGWMVEMRQDSVMGVAIFEVACFVVCHGLSLVELAVIPQTVMSVSCERFS